MSAPKATSFHTATFRSLADRAAAALVLVDATDVERYFGTRFEGIQPSERWSALHAVAKEALCLSGKGESTFATLRRLQREVKLEVAFGIDAEPYGPILDRLADACRDGIPPSFDEEKRWIEAVQAARALRILTGDHVDRNMRDKVVVEAARSLIAAGATLRVENGRYTMDECELARLSMEIDLIVGAIGGLPTIQWTLGYLVRLTPLEFGRYAPGRDFTEGRELASLPIGYLLQLGAKHLNSPPATSARLGALLVHLGKMATDLCAVLDVEPYSNMEHIAFDAHDVPAYLSSIALFDHLFALRQWPPSCTADLLAGVTAGLDPMEMRRRVGWDMADVIALLRAVLKVARDPFRIFHESELLQAGLSTAAWQALKDDFAHARGRVNAKYVSPLDADKAEFDFKPIFELRRGHCLVATPGLACLAFFEAATRRLRTAGYPKLDELLAKNVETVVQSILRASGLNVTVSGVEYFPTTDSRSKADGECDVVVETEETIVFIELKKKPLRRISSTGDAAAGLVDLSASLFAAQAQLARHEHHLLADGKIAFANGYVLELRGRQIDRIAMTWLDYGGLQDKVLLDQLFRALIGHRVTTAHPREATKIEELNNAIGELEKEFQASIELGKAKHAPFINCWFLSVPQLTMLLDGIDTSDQFDKRIRSLRHISYRTLDFYRDFGFARQTAVI
jgi:Holliday junction resolvase-like predicted endonuclease